MKTRTNRLTHLLCLLLALLTTTFALTSCDAQASEPDPNSEEGQLNTFLKYFDITVTGAERVGNNLMVDMKIRNKTGQDTRFHLLGAHVTDNLGKEYESIFLRLARGMYNDPAAATYTTIPANTTIDAALQVRNFGRKTDNKRSISFYIRAQAPQMEMSESVKIPMSDHLTFADHRVTTNGIEHCDRKLKFTLLGCHRSGSDCIVDYSIENLTEQDLAFVGEPVQADDDLGTTYISFGMAYGDEPYSGSVRAVTIPSGKRVLGSVLVNGFSNRASSINIYMRCSENNYQYFFDEDFAYFFDIPVGNK